MTPEELYESIGGDLCICQRQDVSSWCEKCQWRISVIAGEMKLAAAPVLCAASPADPMADAAEMLWIVLANVSGGDWTQQSEDWRDAAARWRDNYFDVLARLRGEAAVRVEE